MEFKLFEIMRKLKPYYRIDFSMTNSFCWVEVSKLYDNLTEDEVVNLYFESDKKIPFSKFKKTYDDPIILTNVRENNFEDVYRRLVKLYEEAISDVDNSCDIDTL